ncbi:hypothetical protein CC77DRAFT_624538 [Alternaria alternata]|uniref:Uncharacterized protein n=1 Tax=Alternaria alternata TaxID=5599 RepID=A0A177DWD2_ALTAL|nr:hypothetical protein CC77DRAFT_624538 [Alternaria alternata]OAG23768.1 hypothetical protein CC77DRAFT_624538 [Alternaria alternata]
MMRESSWLCWCSCGLSWRRGQIHAPLRGLLRDISPLLYLCDIGVGCTRSSCLVGRMKAVSVGMQVQRSGGRAPPPQAPSRYNTNALPRSH